MSRAQQLLTRTDEGRAPSKYLAGQRYMVVQEIYALYPLSSNNPGFVSEDEMEQAVSSQELKGKTLIVRGEKRGYVWMTAESGDDQPTFHVEQLNRWLSNGAMKRV